MTPLAELLVRRIRAEGPMSISEYMSLCLTHPQHGYYTTRDPLGRGGDFVTAPEVSQMFGELIGLAFAQYWTQIGRPGRVVLAELGPGRGTLMADFLRATRGIPGFHDALDLWLVEASPVLRDRQAQVLARFSPHWCEGVGDLPEGPLFLIANEFFDAIPIRQFLRWGDGWVERLIGLDQGNDLTFGLGPETSFGALSGVLGQTAERAIVEVSSGQAALIGEIGRRLAAQGGAALVIDYGDWGSDADTLQAVAGHKKIGPLELPGQSDLTAHVDFRALAAALPEGVAASELIEQGRILASWGIAARAEALARGLAGDALDAHVAAFHRLTSPGEMGSLFRMMAVTKNGAPAMPGFDHAG